MWVSPGEFVMYSRNDSSNLSSSIIFFIGGNKIDISQVLIIKPPIFSSSASAILRNLIVIVSLRICLVICPLPLICCKISSSRIFLTTNWHWDFEYGCQEIYLSHLHILYSPKIKWNYRLCLLLLLLLLARWSKIS